MLKYAEAFQALASDEQAVALEELRTGAWVDFDQGEQCTAICAVTLGHAFAIPESGPESLRQVAKVALGRRHLFATLGSDVQVQVLRELFDCGYANSQRNAGPARDAQRLARYIQLLSLALGDGLLLPTSGKVDLRRATHEALRLHGAFSSLPPLATASVLGALGNGAFLFGQRSLGSEARDRELAGTAQVWCLALGHDLSLADKRAVDLAGAEQIALTCRETFLSLDQETQSWLVAALGHAGGIHEIEDADELGKERCQARYVQSLSLALGDALLAGVMQPTDSLQAAQAALACCKGFQALGANLQGQLLTILFNSGLAYSRKSRHVTKLKIVDRALARYAQCWSLALRYPLELPEVGPVELKKAAEAAQDCRDTFLSLSPHARSAVLNALLETIICEGRRLRRAGRNSRNATLARFSQLWCLALGDAPVLREDGAVTLAGAAQEIVCIREAFFSLGDRDVVCVIGAVCCVPLFGLSASILAVTLSLGFALLPRDHRDVTSFREFLILASLRSRHSRHSWGAASVWLLRLDALPVMPDRPGQVSTTVMIGSQLLALERGVHHPLRRWLRDLSFDRGRAELSGVVCQQRDWPTRFTELPHFMLALGLAGSDDALPSRAVASTWGADIAELAQRSDWLRCLDADGSARRSYILGVGGSARREHTQFPFDAGRWQLDESEHSRWAAWLITLSEGEPLDDIELEFAGWWQQALYTVEALFTWRRRWLPQEDAEVAWQTSARAVVMAQTDRFVQQVWQQTGASLPAGAQAVALGSPDAAPSNTASNLLLAGLNPAHVGKTDRLLHAQQYWSAQLLPQTDDSAQVWRLLELSRHSLLPAKPGSAKWQDWDQPALDALVAAETRVLNDAQARLDAQAQGRPEPPNCLNADRPVEPFATMAEQWERMGVGLDIPEVAAVVQCLAAHEALAQPWWNPDGGGELLLLQPHQGLQRLAMPAHLNAAHWQTLTQHWQRAAQADGNEGIDESMRNQAFAQAWQSMADLQGVAVALWRWLRAQAGETCTNLIVVWPADKAAWPWQALVETLEPADSGVTLELAVGANALMKSRAAPPIADVPDNTPASGKPPSHAALLSDDLWNSAHPVHVLASRLEASVLPQVLRAQAQRSADAACYVRALQCNGMVHLAAHGVYDEGQPMASHLVLHDPQGVQAEAQQPELAQRRARRRFAPPEQVAEGQAEADTEALVQAQKDRCRLPAWLLAEMNLSQPEVSLSACQALRTGQGDAQAALRGPAGLGAVLSAAGARSVVGSLWICESLGIVVFYERWFAHRQHHDALRALRLARQDLRAMTWADCQRWLEQALQQAQREGVLGAEQQRELIKTAQEALQRSQDDANFTGRVEGPFAHPIDWAGMCLIGNGPARPDAAQRGQEPATATNRWQRLRNAWQQLQQALGLGSARR